MGCGAVRCGAGVHGCVTGVCEQVLALSQVAVGGSFCLHQLLHQEQPTHRNSPHEHAISSVAHMGPEPDQTKDSLLQLRPSPAA